MYKKPHFQIIMWSTGGKEVWRKRAAHISILWPVADPLSHQSFSWNLVPETVRLGDTEWWSFTSLGCGRNTAGLGYFKLLIRSFDKHESQIENRKPSVYDQSL